MRLFLAIDLPDDVKRRLATGSAMHRESLPKTRWVREETLHLTLVFLGEVDSALVPTIDRALKPVFASRATTTARIGSGGAFPPRGKARVLWASFEVDGDLVGLHRNAESALASIDAGEQPLYEPESRRFHPHVTVARCRNPWSRPAVDRWVQGFGRPDLSFPIREGTLFESHLRPSGPRYRSVSTYPLGTSGD